MEAEHWVYPDKTVSVNGVDVRIVMVKGRDGDKPNGRWNAYLEREGRQPVAIVNANGPFVSWRDAYDAADDYCRVANELLASA